MNLGKIIQTLLFLAVVVMIVRFVAVSIKTSGPPPVQYSIRFESRVSPDQNGLQVTNLDAKQGLRPITGDRDDILVRTVERIIDFY